MQTNDEPQNSFLKDEQIASNYRILRPLGKGAMGDVYLAEQIHVGRRPVALKILNRECAANPQLVKRFESEAATAGRIHHRNVVTVYESRLTDQGHFYVSMEYVAGRTLREELAARGALPLGEVVEITKQICAGLAAAHKLGVVHRDIKPDNIMLVHSDEDDEGLTAKVLDFGIARLSESQSLSMQTAPGLIIGTPAYLSPEQAAGAIGNQIDSRADIYSLGMVIYEMLTGRVAFYSDSWLAIVRQQLYDLPPSPSQLVAGIKISPAIEQVVMRSLEKDREKRQQTAAQFARELEQAYSEYNLPTEKLASKPTVPLPVAATAKRSWIQQNWKLAAAGSAMVLILIAAAIWFTGKDKNQSSSVVTPANPSPSNPPVISTAPPAHLDVMSFRVTRKDPVENLATLPLDLTVKSSERISFDFKLAKPGTVYLMLQNDDHSWRWLDATPNGQAATFPADRWNVMPRDSWYVLDDKTGLESFWLFYVPREINWSLAELIAPAVITVERGGHWDRTAMIEPGMAEKVSNWFKTNGTELKASGSRLGKEALFNLWQEVEPSKPSFYRIELKHIQ